MNGEITHTTDKRSVHFNGRNYPYFEIKLFRDGKYCMSGVVDGSMADQISQEIKLLKEMIR